MFLMNLVNKAASWKIKLTKKSEDGKKKKNRENSLKELSQSMHSPLSFQNQIMV